MEKVNNTKFICGSGFSPSASKTSITAYINPGEYEVEFIRDAGINIISKCRTVLIALTNEEVSEY